MTNFQTMKLLSLFQLLKQKHHSNQYGSLNRKQKAFGNPPISSWLSKFKSQTNTVESSGVFTIEENLDKIVKKVGYVEFF